VVTVTTPPEENLEVDSIHDLIGEDPDAVERLWKALKKEASCG
jgi:hypothetical protein